MKKKILFVVTHLGTGGIMRSLQNFLNRYDTTKYKIDVFAMVHQGVYCDALKNYTLLPKNIVLDASLAHFDQRHGFTKFESFFAKLLNKITHYQFQEWIFYQASNKLIHKIHYDAVIGFGEGLPTAFVAAMNHPNKIGWIHCDYANYMKIGGKKSEQHIYETLKSVVCVSEFTRDSFISIYPMMREKTYAIYNIIDDAMMKAKSTEPINEFFDDSFFNIISIGRIDPVKRLSIVPILARKVVDSGCKIRWYVIGPKGTVAELTIFNENIIKYHVEDVVIPLGEKANPYPYIVKSDLLVNPSVSESWSYVINEAKVLATPVICTDFGCAREVVDYDINGYYEPIEKMAERITWLIKNPSELARLKHNLASFKYDNNTILNKIYFLIERSA